MAVQCGFEQTQWQIQERPPPPFLDQTEAQRAKKYIFETSPNTSPQGLDDCPLPTPAPLPLSEGLDAPFKQDRV